MCVCHQWWLTTHMSTKIYILFSIFANVDFIQTAHSAHIHVLYYITYTCTHYIAMLYIQYKNMNSVICPGINGVLTKLANGKREKSEIERSPKIHLTPPMSFLFCVLLWCRSMGVVWADHNRAPFHIILSAHNVFLCSHYRVGNQENNAMSTSIIPGAALYLYTNTCTHIIRYHSVECIEYGEKRTKMFTIYMYNKYVAFVLCSTFGHILPTHSNTSISKNLHPDMAE